MLGRTTSCYRLKNSIEKSWIEHINRFNNRMWK